MLENLSNVYMYVCISCVFVSAVHKHCHEIKQKGQNRFNPLNNRKYGIDPDRQKGVPLFSVQCDFNTVKSLGITLVNVLY